MASISHEQQPGRGSAMAPRRDIMALVKDPYSEESHSWEHKDPSSLQEAKPGSTQTAFLLLVFLKGLPKLHATKINHSLPEHPGRGVA